MNTLVESEIRDVPEATNGTPARPPVIVRTLDQFKLDDETIAKTLAGLRWLCRGGSLLLCGPTGIGKSSFRMQAAVSWALGLPFFRIKSTGKLKVLVFDGENNDGDVAEMRDGIFRGLEVSKEQQAEAGQQIIVVCESSLTGDDFVALVREQVAKHKPDLLVIDPLFAYLGDSVNEQRAVSAFLRNGLNPILQEHGCGLVLVHHTNKPKSGKEKPDWQAGDLAYLGAGTAELANWARAVMSFRSVGSHSVFEIVLPKRGRRAGLVNEEGEPVYSFHVKHSAVGICWETATEDDLPGDDDGRHAVTIKDVEAEFDGGAVHNYNKLVELLSENHGVSPRTAKRAIARAVGDSKIRRTSSGLYELSSQTGDR